MYKNILIATDGSELADKAVSQGLALAKAAGVGLYVPFHHDPAHTDAIMAKLEAEATREGISAGEMMVRIASKAVAGR